MIVYRYGLLAPTTNAALVRAQLRAAHDYRNELVAIERGRRSALRDVDAASAAVVEAEAVVRANVRAERSAVA